VASLHAVERHADVERSQSRDGGKVLGERELGRRHVGGGRDETDRGRVARPSGNLATIGQRGPGEGQGAEVDVVVRRGRRSTLASNRGVLPIVSEVGANDRGVEGQG